MYKNVPDEVSSQQELGERGEFTSLVHRSAKGEVEIQSVARRDRVRHYFITTTSDTQPGEPARRNRLRKTLEGVCHVSFTIPRPQVVCDYYNSCAAIDSHNRGRQADLMLERKLGTKRWDFRLNCSLLGMLIVDSWLMGVKGVRSGYC